jgi:hypothetical protein
MKNKFNEEYQEEYEVGKKMFGDTIRDEMMKFLIMRMHHEEYPCPPRQHYASWKSVSDILTLDTSPSVDIVGRILEFYDTKSHLAIKIVDKKNWIRVNIFNEKIRKKVNQMSVGDIVKLHNVVLTKYKGVNVINVGKYGMIYNE